LQLKLENAVVLDETHLWCLDAEMLVQVRELCKNEIPKEGTEMNLAI